MALCVLRALHCELKCEIYVHDGRRAGKSPMTLAGASHLRSRARCLRTVPDVRIDRSATAISRENRVDLCEPCQREQESTGGWGHSLLLVQGQCCGLRAVRYSKAELISN